MPEIQIKSFDGSVFDAYVTEGSKPGVPGLLFIHGACGFDAGAQAMCDALGAMGYFVLCPFLFGSDKPVFLAPPEPTQPSGSVFSSIYKGLDVGAALRTLLAGLAHLRKASRSGVGTIGFCLGGTLAFLLSARSDVDLVVGYDCAGLESFSDEALDIRVPTLLHMGERDAFALQDMRQKTIKKLALNENIVVHLYPEAGHGFVNKLDAGYHAASATQAEQRTQTLLTEKLKI